MTKLKDFENPVLKASGSGSRGQIYHIPEERPVKHPIPTCSSRKANNYNIFERAVLEERSFHEPCSRCYGLDGEGDLGKRADYSCPSCGHNTLETDSAKANFVCENCGERVREVVYDE